jgi:hypothetical protein
MFGGHAHPSALFKNWLAPAPPHRFSPSAHGLAFIAALMDPSLNAIIRMLGQCMLGTWMNSPTLTRSSVVNDQKDIDPG